MIKIKLERSRNRSEINEVVPFAFGFSAGHFVASGVMASLKATTTKQIDK